MKYAQPRIRPENETHKLLWNTNGSPNLDQTTRPSDKVKKKKKKKKEKKKKKQRICQLT